MDKPLCLSENSSKSLTQIYIFENAEGKQCVSARELHERLESNERFSKWWERFSNYGFEVGSDFTSVPFSTVVNNGAKKEIGDYEITIEMAKQICMLQKTDKGREYREYFLNLEKVWNSPEAIMSRALQIANKTLEDAKNQVVILQQKVEITEAKNEALASDVLTWADRKVIQAIINKYGANILNGNFQLAWSEYKKELLYKYSINLNSRKTAYYNNGGKESNLKVLNLLEDSEVPDAVRTAIAMAEKVNLNISEIVENKLNSKKNKEILKSFENAAELLNVSVDDVIQFLLLRQYIKAENNGYVATPMGIELGYVDNVGKNAHLRIKGFEKIRKAFNNDLTPEQQKRVDELCAEAERKARPSKFIGRAE